VSNTRLFIKIGAGDAGAKAALGQLGAQVRRLAGDAQAAERHLGAMMSSFKKAAALGAGAYGLGKVMAPALRESANYEASLKRLKAELEKPGKAAAQLQGELEALGKTAREMQRVTSFDAKGVLEMELRFIKGGLSVEEITKDGAGKAGTLFATAYKDQVSPPEAADIILKTAAGLGSKEYERLAQLYGAAASSAATDIQPLFQGIRKATGITKRFGIKDEEMFAAIATMQGRSIQDAISGEAFTAFLTKQAAAWNDPKKRPKLKEIGIKPFIEEGPRKGAYIGFLENIRQWRKAYALLKTDIQQTRVLMDVFGEDYVKSAPALFEGGENKIEDILAKMAQAPSLQTRSDILGEGLQESYTRWLGNLGTVAGQVMDPLLDDLTAGVKLTDEITTKLGGLMAAKPTLNKTLAYALPTAAGALSVGALAYLFKGLYHGGRAASLVKGPLLQRLLGRGQTVGVELAQAKALEAAAGVMPVSVINWPPLLAKGAGLGNGVLGPSVFWQTPQAAESLKAASRMRALGLAALRVAGPLSLVSAGFYALWKVTEAAEAKNREVSERIYPTEQRPGSALTGRPMNDRELTHLYGSVAAARKAWEEGRKKGLHVGDLRPTTPEEAVQMEMMVAEVKAREAEFNAFFARLRSEAAEKDLLDRELLQHSARLREEPEEKDLIERISPGYARALIREGKDLEALDRAMSFRRKAGREAEDLRPLPEIKLDVHLHIDPSGALVTDRTLVNWARRGGL